MNQNPNSNLPTEGTGPSIPQQNNNIPPPPPQGPQNPQYTPYMQPPVFYANPPYESAANASLICGIVGIFLLFSLCIYGIIPSVVLGIIALVQASKVKRMLPPGFKCSKATAGKVMGILSIVFSILSVIIFVLLITFLVGIETYDYSTYSEIFQELEDLALFIK